MSTFHPAQDVLVNGRRQVVEHVELMERWVVAGPDGAVQFVWMNLLDHDVGVDIGFHFPTQHDLELTYMESCDYLAQGFCYYKGTGVAADRLLQEWDEQGRDRAFMWNYLHALYNVAILQQLPQPKKGEDLPDDD